MNDLRPSRNHFLASLVLVICDTLYCTKGILSERVSPDSTDESILVTELCVLRTFGGVDFSLIFICAQYVPEFLWDRLRASIQFPVMPKRAQYARFSGEYCSTSRILPVYV